MLIACSDEDDKPNKSIIGKWKVETFSKPSNYDECDYDGWIIINQETYTEYDACDGSTIKGTWSSEKNKITITTPEIGSVVATLVELSENKMTLSFTTISTGIEYIYYKRIE